MRKLLLLLVALAWVGQVDGDEGPAVKKAVPVSEASAHTYVRKIVEQARGTPATLSTPPSTFGLKPAALSRRTYGADYAALSEAQREVVDRYSWALMSGMLRTFHRSRAEELELTSQPHADGTRTVSVAAGRRLVQVVVARNSGDGQLEVVDLGSDGKHLGSKLKEAWGKIKERADEGADHGELLVSFLTGLIKRTQDRVRKVKAKDNIKSLVTWIMARVVERGWKYFPFGGKCFVLGLVASGDIDKRMAANLTVLFSPNVRKTERAPLEAYRGVTKGSLAAGYDCSKLTSYAGRRNNEAEHLVTAEEQARGAIIIADLSFEDVVIAGFSDGRVEELTREELGLGPDDPFTVGDEAKSELLKKLSLK